MGLTAEEVAKKYNITREDQDEFAFNSHMKALDAIKDGKFTGRDRSSEVEETYLDEDGRKQNRTLTIDTDEGPRADTNLEALAKLKPVFSMGGTVTAGNSSQTSDGAAFVIVMSERMVKELNLEPIARLVSYAVAGIEPKIMGIGPVKAVPKALEACWIETVRY